jgi:hypothetical protein
VAILQLRWRWCVLLGCTDLLIRCLRCRCCYCCPCALTAYGGGGGGGLRVAAIPEEWRTIPPSREDASLPRNPHHPFPPLSWGVPLRAAYAPTRVDDSFGVAGGASPFGAAAATAPSTIPPSWGVPVFGNARAYAPTHVEDRALCAARQPYCMLQHVCAALYYMNNSPEELELRLEAFRRRMQWKRLGAAAAAPIGGGSSASSGAFTTFGGAVIADRSFTSSTIGGIHMGWTFTDRSAAITTWRTDDAGFGFGVKTGETRAEAAAKAAVKAAETRAEAAKAAEGAMGQAAEKLAGRIKRLQGDPAALLGCSLDELRRLVGDIELGRSRAREALEQAESLAKALSENPLTCCVCLERRKDTALGRGHVLCESCAERVRSCPTCSRPVTERKRVYL